MTPDYWEQAKQHLSKKDKVMAKIIRNYEKDILTCRGDQFFTLARAIVGQQISVKAADAIFKRFEALSGMDPVKVADLSVEDLRGIGLSGSKANYIKNIAEFCISTPSVGHLEDDEAMIKELTKIKGVGRWTAEMFLMFHLLRGDVLPLGDIGLLKGFEMHYKRDRRELPKFAERWRPYRSVATWYLWRSLDPVAVAY